MNKLTIVYGILLILTLSACGKPQDGKAGADGSNGHDGHDGTNASCTVKAIQGGSLISCSDGSSSLVLNGTNGTNGQNGTPGSVIKPTTLCAEDKTVYPKVFAEVAFCIDGDLYAVYSENNGFLSLIPNGSYTSNGHNSSCSFKVSGCKVTK